MSGQFSANASALGYFYQARYALLLLMDEGKTNPDAEMSIERFDDVAFEKAENPTALIQTKHHFNSSASLSDSSTDLWKTIRIWCTESLKHGWDTDTLLFTLVTTALAPTGSIASKLCPSSSGFRNVDDALIALCNVAKTSVNQDNKSAYDAFLSLNENQQRTLLGNVRILDASPNILDVRNKILVELRYTTKYLESMYERLEGWWFRKVIEHLSQDSNEPISHRELLAKLYDLQQQFHQDNLPTDFPEPIDLDSKENTLNENQRLFIEQLQLIKVSSTRIRIAVDDYHKAYKQRSRWVREELLLIEELTEYEDRLHNEWQRYYEIMKEYLEEDAVEEKMLQEGKKLFNEVDKMNFPIRPRCIEPYITRGSYHMLSNQLRVGWHVEFFNRLGHLVKLSEEITA